MAYHSSRSHLAYLEKEYERQKELRKSNITSEKTFQKTEANYRILKTQVAALREKLKLIGISANQLFRGKIVRAAKLFAPFPVL